MYKYCRTAVCSQLKKPKEKKSCLTSGKPMSPLSNVRGFCASAIPHSRSAFSSAPSASRIGTRAGGALALIQHRTLVPATRNMEYWGCRSDCVKNPAYKERARFSAWGCRTQRWVGGGSRVLEAEPDSLRGGGVVLLRAILFVNEHPG